MAHWVPQPSKDVCSRWREREAWLEVDFLHPEAGGEEWGAGTGSWRGGL